MDQIEWSGQLQAWMSSDGPTIRNILRDDNFEVIDFRSIYRLLAERFSTDFDATLGVLDHVPLGLTGPEHRAARKRQTLYLKKMAEPGLSAFDTELEACAARIFSAPGQVELVSEFTAPITAALFRVLSELDAVDGTDPSLSQVFDRMLSVNRRKNINQRIKEHIADIPQIEFDADAIMKVSLAIVGADSFFSTISQSLISVLESNPGTRLCDIDWPREPIRSGVPCVDRFAISDADVSGKTIKAGDRVRLYIEGSHLCGNANPPDFFGIGGHVCLGKAISLRAWSKLAERLAKFDTRATVTSHTFRRSDYLFNAPEQLEVRIEHG